VGLLVPPGTPPHDPDDVEVRREVRA
jgi:hypothetical protein